MRLEKVRIKGFRNFDDTEVIFQKKTLIRSNLFLALLTSFIFHKLLFLFQAMLRGILQNMRLLIT